MKLPRLTNDQYELVEKRATIEGIPLDQCPTCLTKVTTVSSDVHGWENGTYRYKGEEHACDCDTQKALRKHYLLANIPTQYMRLDWATYEGDEKIREDVDTYLTRWPSFRLNGMGVEFYSPTLGTGKTFGATHIGKELVKQGERVFFIPFREVISAYESSDKEFLESQMRNTTVLILDEVIPPVSERQGSLFAEKFEELIRHRTNFNLPTLMTTNLTPNELSEWYPRTYSLLEAKQLRIKMTGNDARQGRIDIENLELAMNGEVRPLT